MVHPGTAVLNGIETNIGFGNAYFSNIPFGHNYSYTLSTDGLPDHTGTISDLYKNMDIYVVMGGVDIDENQSDIIVAYPNWTEGILFIDGLQSENYVQVVDMSGKTVFEQYNVANKSKIDLTYLNRGVYILNIKSGTNTINQKIVIK